MAIISAYLFNSFRFSSSSLNCSVGSYFLLICASLHSSWYFGSIVIGTVLVYFVYTYYTTEWRNAYRREMNARDNDFNQVCYTQKLFFFLVLSCSQISDFSDIRNQRTLF